MKLRTLPRSPRRRFGNGIPFPLGSRGSMRARRMVRILHFQRRRRAVLLPARDRALLRLSQFLGRRLEFFHVDALAICGRVWVFRDSGGREQDEAVYA